VTHDHQADDKRRNASTLAGSAPGNWMPKLQHPQDPIARYSGGQMFQGVTIYETTPEIHLTIEGLEKLCQDKQAKSQYQVAHARVLRGKQANHQGAEGGRKELYE
jgi:hypothetical protein